jgi:hypothetical protein
VSSVTWCSSSSKYIAWSAGSERGCRSQAKSEEECPILDRGGDHYWQEMSCVQCLSIPSFMASCFKAFRPEHDLVTYPNRIRQFFR